jgi:hypothetical protein
MVIPHRSLGAAADPPCAMNRAVVAIIRGMDVAYEFAWVASRGRNHSGACIGHGGGGGAKTRQAPVRPLPKLAGDVARVGSALKTMGRGQPIGS